MNSTRLARLSIILASFTFYSEQSWADLWQSALTSSVSADYSVNPALQAGNTTGVWLGTLNPSYTLSRTAGADELKAGATLYMVESSNIALSANRTDPSVFLNWLRKNNTGEFGISTRYEQVATRSATDSSSQFFIDSTRVTRTLSGNWSRTLNERNALSANVVYSSVYFTGSGNYVDYSSQTSTLNYSHGLSENVVPFLSVSYTDMKFTGGQPSSRRINPMLGLNWKISEHLDSTLSAGESREIGVSGDNKQLSLLVQYTGRLTNLTFNADRTSTPSGLGGFITANRVSGIMSHDLSESSKTGMSLTWVKDFTITNDAYGTFDAWLQHDLNARWNIKTHYSHKIHEGGGLATATSNVVGVSLVYNRSEF